MTITICEMGRFPDVPTFQRNLLSVSGLAAFEKCHTSTCEGQKLNLVGSHLVIKKRTVCCLNAWPRR